VRGKCNNNIAPALRFIHMAAWY